MNKSGAVCIGILFLGLSLPGWLCGQAAVLSPAQPKWGDTLRISYNPAAGSPALAPGDQIYAVYFAYFKDSSRQKWVGMEKDGQRLRAEIPIEKGMAFVTVYFLTLDTWDRKTSASTMVYRPDGMPAEGANQNAMLSLGSERDYLDFFRRERELYPDNYAVFRDKWFVMQVYDRENQKSAVSGDMPILQDPGILESACLLFALNYGHLILENEAASLKVMRRMVEAFPRSHLTGLAIQSYDDFVFSNQIEGEGPKEAEALKRRLIEKSPESEYARDQVVYLAGREDMSLSLTDRICRPWMKDAPDNPQPHYALALAHLTQNQSLEQAQEFIDRAASLLFQGKLRFYRDISGEMTRRAMPLYLHLSSKIRFQQGDFTGALRDLKAARAFQDEVDPDFFLHEAHIWSQLGYAKNAEHALLEAHRLGGPEAKAELEALYRKRNGTGEGFRAYLDEKSASVRAKSKEHKEPAPKFEIKNLKGETLSLARLKGKVVVINFWFIGCAPCRVEIPGLNALTEEFKEDDVVFIAFALDEAQNLKAFIKDHPFTYQIVPESQAIAQNYGVQAYPTHIILNREGKIEYRLTGGSPTRHEQLRPLINNLLQKTERR